MLFTPSSPVSSSLSSEFGLVLFCLLDISNPVLDRTHGFSRSSQVVYPCMSHFAYYKFSWADFLVGVEAHGAFPCGKRYHLLPRLKDAGHGRSLYVTFSLLL